MARPRRFGKSLLVSTLHCLFEGRRELFKGLAIEPKWDWTRRGPSPRSSAGMTAIGSMQPQNGSSIRYNLTDRQNEQMWQTVVYVLLKSVGFGVNAEVMTNEGRIDMTCETSAGIWLIEFKLDRPAEEALAQIDERNYAEKYDFSGKTVRKLGLSFSSERRTIVDVCVA